MAVDFLTEQDAFSEEEDASFGTGNTDMVGQWLSMIPTKKGGIINGLVFPAGVNDDFDGAVEALNADRVSQGKPVIERVTAVHTVQQGQKNGANIKDYWKFEEFSLFVIAKGLKEPMADQGIVYCWTLDERKKFKVDDNGKPRPNNSNIRFRAYLHELTGPGYYLAPVQITGKAFKCLEFQKALRDQQRVIQAYRDLINNPKAVVPFWAFSIPMRCGELKPYGKETPKDMVLVESAIPEKITKEYLQERYVTGTELETSLKNMIRTELENTLVWAKETTQRLLQGKEEKGQNTFSQSDKSWEEYMNESWEEPRLGYEEEVVQSNPATDNQRSALMKIGGRLKDNNLIALSKKEGLTFDEASKAIKAASSKK